jgi:hypothetical protein
MEIGVHAAADGPQLAAVHSVVGAKEEIVASERERRWVGAV